MTDIYNGDCVELMHSIPDGSVDLVLADPPYNIGVTTQIGGKARPNQWDKIENYTDWFIGWVKEAERVLKPSGVLYFWHNDMKQIAEIICKIYLQTGFALRSFCIWDKGDAYRAQTWHNRKTDGKAALRLWFNVCEFCLHFVKTPGDGEKQWAKTGLDYINSNPDCYKPLKEWYANEKTRLGVTDKEIAEKYTGETGKKPYMLRHYFNNSQFEIPTRRVWESVYVPLGFNREYEGLRREYEGLRREYEGLRYTHNCDKMHCNMWRHPPIPSNRRYHTCEKPVDILERIITVSSNPGDVVLDPFMGSGPTGIACINTKRDFIGMEKDKKYFDIARERIEEHKRRNT